MKLLNKAKKAIEQGKIVEISFNKKQDVNFIVQPSKRHEVNRSQKFLFDLLTKRIAIFFVPTLKTKISIAKAKSWNSVLPGIQQDDKKILSSDEIISDFTNLVYLLPEYFKIVNGKITVTEDSLGIPFSTVHHLAKQRLEERYKPDVRYRINIEEIQALKTIILNYPVGDDLRCILKEFDALTESEKTSLLIYLAYLYLKTDEEFYKAKRDIFIVLENDRKNREKAKGSEILLTQRRDGLELGKVNYKIVDKSDFNIYDLQALFDIVIRISQIEKSDYIAVVKTDKIGKIVKKEFDKKVSIITASRIRELTGLSTQTAWKIKESIENLANKKIIVELDEPIQLSKEIEVTGWAITPLIEHERSPLHLRVSNKTVEVRIFRLDKLLTHNTKSFVPMFPNTFTRILSSKDIQKRSKPFVADVLLYLLNHRHNDIAYLNIEEFSKVFATKESRSRHVSELVNRIEKSLNWLVELGIIVDFEYSKNTWKVELRFS